MCSGGLFFAGPLIFRLWTHDKSVVFDPTLFGLLLIVGLCNSLWSTSYVVLIAVNRHQRLAAVYVAATALSMAIGYVLTPLLGLPGAALALLVIDVFMSFYVVSRSLELVQDHLGGFLKAVLTPPFLKQIKSRLLREAFSV